MSILSAPFSVLWKLLTTLLGLTGRLLAGVIGLVLLLLGVLLTLTVIGAIIGIPMIVVGLLLLVRSLF